ncbi:hypothetical protein M5689_012432 [Euphorbia peplus]|nr:hypothetical protein M5689_012432 [Euphorbia peplus]
MPASSLLLLEKRLQKLPLMSADPFDVVCFEIPKYWPPFERYHSKQISRHLESLDSIENLFTNSINELGDIFNTNPTFSNGNFSLIHNFDGGQF